MKKLLAGLFIFGFFAIGVQVTHASILSDALSKIDSLQKELMQLKANLGASALASDPGEDPILCPIGSTSCTPTSDTTPRISYWGGKVNQHVDVSSSMWITDPDGYSGSGIDQLTYCKKWYPNTTRVEEYKNETISTWHSAGNVGSYPSTKMSYKCVQENTDIRAFVMLNSPKGGETYTVGQKITIRWKTENIPIGEKNISIALRGNTLDGRSNVFFEGALALETQNDGIETVTLSPDIFTKNNSLFGKFFRVIVMANTDHSYQDESVDLFTINSSTTTPTTDLTPRISYWSGKVNQHVDVAAGMWQTDPDGTSGSGIYQLTYCKKWYPNTTRVESYKNETINAWHSAGNVGSYPSTKMSYKCVQDSIIIDNLTTITYPSKDANFIQGQSNKISWTGGKNKVQIGLVNPTYTSNILTGVVGWIELNGKPDSNITWDGKLITDLSGKNSWNIYPGQYKIIVVSENKDGNYCINTESNEKNCNSNLSDNIYVKSSSMVTTPLVTTTPGEDPTGCPIGAIYSSTTGQLCSSSSNVDTGCSYGDIYSSTTGQKCLNNSTTPSNINSNNTYANNIVSSSQSNQTLKVGVKSDDVKILQRFLGITEDGSFGPMTKAKVMEWQAANGLTPDGAFGKNSRQKAGL